MSSAGLIPVSLPIVLARARAILAAGASGQEALQEICRWEAPIRRRTRVQKTFVRWHSEIVRVLRKTLPLGAPVGKLLGEILPLVRREERLVKKLVGLEAQFSFQAAVSVVIPWGVAFLVGRGMEWNFWFSIGAGFHAIGLLAFLVLLRRASRADATGLQRLFELVTQIWMMARAGLPLPLVLDDVVSSRVPCPVRENWKSWWRRYSAGLKTSEAQTKAISRECSRMSQELQNGLELLLRNGGSCTELLAEYMAQLDDERYFRLEEMVQKLPNQSALVFCLFFTPAAFSILLGAIWPELAPVLGEGGL